MTVSTCAAIDLGAASGRVVVAIFDGDRISLEEAVRFEHPLLKDPVTGYQHWDVDHIESQVRAGIESAERSAPLESVGVDTWGVDYVLVDGQGKRVGLPVSYRDERTSGMIEEVTSKIPAAEIYRRTGIQFQRFNTLYQLAACSRKNPEWIEKARHLLLLPDYFHYRLCGAISNEYTEATTSQLVNLETRDWDEKLLAVAGVPRGLLTTPVEPGTLLGESQFRSGRKVKVVAPGTHDTASAVAAIPLRGPQEAFLSSGTWSLMGIESEVPFADAKASRLNISNEGGVARRYRVLKNIVGLYLLQRIRQEFENPSHPAVVEAARASPAWRSLINPEDTELMNPPSMREAIRALCARTGQPEPHDLGSFARCALDSLALSYRRVKGDLEAVSGRRITRIRIVGGGSQNTLLNQLAADACEVPVTAGPVETSSLGNACVQLIALGALDSLADARALVERSFAVEEYHPAGKVPESALALFQAIAQARR
ncbi:MAG TPA: rhamnulokinase [Anaeromyxobacteraceae bacterium]|nr:rhamnulokinase [Anaeromyxobacteraceae bacterium]